MTSFSFLGTSLSISENFFSAFFSGFISTHAFSTHPPEGPSPARRLKHMGYRVGKVIKSITRGRRSGEVIARILRRPVNQERPANHIFTRHKSPVAAVLTVIAIVAEHKVVTFRDDQLVVLDEFRHGSERRGEGK